MYKYMLVLILAAHASPAMQRPQAPNLPLTQQNLATLNQSTQEVIPMDTSSDTSSGSTTRPASLSLDPMEQNRLIALLDSIDEHSWSTN